MGVLEQHQDLSMCVLVMNVMPKHEHALFASLDKRDMRLACGSWGTMQQQGVLGVCVASTLAKYTDKVHWQRR